MLASGKNGLELLARQSAVAKLSYTLKANPIHALPY